jgi:hypothetical protein
MTITTMHTVSIRVNSTSRMELRMDCDLSKPVQTDWHVRGPVGVVFHELVDDLAEKIKTHVPLLTSHVMCPRAHDAFHGAPVRNLNVE